MGRVIPPQVGTIPVKFHLYWAGSDFDGEVAGFFYAVTETLPRPLPGTIRPPALPGPRAQDYRFTTRTDTTFIFNVSEFSPDRQHAFFLYAIDNKGKADPTPARFIFNAQDRFPPLPVLDESSATGTVFRQRLDGSLFTKDTTYFVSDTLNPSQITREFVPVNSKLTFRWHAEPTSPLLIPSGFRYKLDESDFVSVDSSVTEKIYAAGTVGPGQKIFTLRALDQAGGARSITRRFGMNLAPDTWWSGPDPNLPIWSSRPRHAGTTEQIKYLRRADWRTNPPVIPGSLLSCDSITVLPSARPFRRTFLEVYKDTLYLRAEGDTVHLNSWVILSSGGFDPDSPYNVRFSPIDPAIPDSTVCPSPPSVMRPGPANGSPVGFRAFAGNFLDPFGPFSQPSVTGLYPLFDPTDFRRQPTVSSYQRMIHSGKVYATTRSEDGTGQDLGGLDVSIPSSNALKGWTDRIDQMGGTPQEVLLRGKKVVTFHVNFAPFLLTSSPTFSPKLPVDTLATRQVNLNLLANDIDPKDPNVINPPIGGPTENKVFRFTVRFRGKNAAGRDTIIAPLDLHQLSAVNASPYPIPSDLVGRNVDVLVELCDCRECALRPGAGKCIEQVFPLLLPAPQSVSRLSVSEGGLQSGPGSSNARVRSKAQ